MAKFVVEKFTDRWWAWCASGDTEREFWAPELPKEVVDFCNSGGDGEVEVYGVTYRVERIAPRP